MKKLFFLVLYSSILFAIPSTYAWQNFADTSIVAENSSISVDFHQTMLHLAEPSTVSTGLPYDTYRFFGVPQKRPLIINADSKFPIALAGKNWYSRRSGLFYTLQMVPQFQVRIFRDDPMQGDSSRSVRTPGYIPGGNLFLTHKSLWGRDWHHKSGQTIREHYFFKLRIFHHSNGQDQKEFREDGTVNTYNGNFGEGLVFEGGLGGYYTWKPQRADSSSRRRLFFYPKKFQYFYQQQFNAYWKFSYEYHPVITERVTTNTAFDQYDLLGRNILRLQLGLISVPKTEEYALYPDGRRVLQSRYRARERWRAVVNLSYIADRELNRGSIYDLRPIGLGNLGRRVNLDLTFYKKTYGNTHAAWFAQVGYYGSDPYNLYFQESVLFYRVGVAWSVFKMKS